MTDTANLGLPYIDAAQAQKHVTHNEALQILDTLVQLAVLDRDLAAPPGAPSEGQRWIVAASPTGAWVGHANHVAAWQDGAWQLSAPRVGWLAYVVDEGRLLTWNGTAWTDALSMLTTLQNVTLLGVGTTADSTNPFSAKLNNALWVAKTVAEGGDGHLRYKLSKESASKTLSFLFQNNFSGRAEFGLTGDDNFHIKVSSDGSSWKEALSIDSASGKVGLGTTAPTQIIDAAGSAAALAIWDDRSYATGRGGSILLQASNDSPARFTGASISAYATTGTNGAEVADLVFSTMKAGTLTQAWKVLGSGAFVPAADDGAAIGSTALKISDGFWATGAVQNYGNGNVVWTHSSGLHTLTVGRLALSDTTPSTSTTTGALTVASLGVAGAVNLGTTLGVIGNPANQWSIDGSSNTTASIASGASLNLPVGNGLILITTGDQVGLFVMGGNGGCIKLADTAAVFENNNTPSSGTTGLAMKADNSAYAIFNNTGSAKTYNLLMFKINSGN